jgi:hypothetical protein
MLLTLVSEHRAREIEQRELANDVSRLPQAPFCHQGFLSSRILGKHPLSQPTRGCFCFNSLGHPRELFR